MIEVINLCQLYKKWKVIKIKQIYDYNNLANSIIKTKSFLILKIIININYINLDTIKYVEQMINIKKQKKV